MNCCEREEDRRFSIIRFLLGLALFLSFSTFLRTSGMTMAFAILAMGCSLAFAFGYASRWTGVVVLILHLYLDRRFVTYGWQPLVDPFLMATILSLGSKPRMIWCLRLTRILTCLVLGWVAWAQVTTTPWLEPEMVTRYIAYSPFGAVSSNYVGILPLVEIFGGFAWLLQLAAPIVLWSKRFASYWIVLLTASHLILSFFMPLEFYVFAVPMAMMVFVPSEWLSMDLTFWRSKLPDIKDAGRSIGFVLLMFIMPFTIFDRNIAEQFDIFERIGSASLEKTYEIVANPFVRAGNLIQFNSIWKMYSPTWRNVVWIDWYVKNANGQVVNWPQENFSPDYRMHRRTWTETLWTDFKKEKVFVGMLSRESSRIAYGKYLCHVIAKKTGVMPISLHAQINLFSIRGPDETWSLKKQGAENVRRDPEIFCD